MESLECFGIGDTDILGTAGILEPSVLRADTRIVEAGRDRVRLDDLAIFVLQQVGAIAVQHAGAAAFQRCGMTVGVQSVTSSFDANKLDTFDRDVRIEDTHCVRTAADTSDRVIGLAATLLLHLANALLADHGLEITHHHRIRMRAGNSADDVEGVGNVGHPVAHGFVQRILERLRTRFDGHDGGAEQLHAIDVGCLALDVLAAHVDHAFHAVAGGDGGRRHAMLASAGFGDDARLAHAAGEHGLADAVVHLVRASMVQVFALEVDLCAAQNVRPAFGVVDRARTTDVVFQVVFELGDELRITQGGRIGFLQLIEGRNQGLGNKESTVGSEVPFGIRQVIHLHCELQQ